jgi:2-polyprenyl-3-methyl-5-hydroxy-6-metoxy-1,4-benzoquinol methylase
MRKCREPHYSSELKDYGWKSSSTCAHSYLLPDLIRIIGSLPLDREAQILDAGCGGGYVASELYKFGVNRIWGFDASESGIKICREILGEAAMHFAVHDAYNRQLPTSFPDGNYDLVLSVEVVEHLISPSSYAKSIHAWLKPGGYLILSTPYHGYWKNLALSLTGKWDKHHTVDWEGGHIKFFSRRTLYGLLRAAGLEPLRFHGSGRLPYLWKSMIVVAQK